MPNILTNKVALITGGTSGIGQATVELFIAEGAKVLFTGRGEEKGQEIAARLGDNAVFFKADVTQEAEIKASVDQAIQSFGRLDILFNNAGGGTLGDIEDVTQEQFHYAMDLLVGSVLYAIKYATPLMKAQGSGRIINNSSISAIRTHMGGYLYSGAKAAVSQFTRMAGMDLGRYGITVNAISPGAVATPVFYGGSSRARTLDDAEKVELNLPSYAKKSFEGDKKAEHPMDGSGACGVVVVVSSTHIVVAHVGDCRCVVQHRSSDSVTTSGGNRSESNADNTNSEFANK